MIGSPLADHSASRMSIYDEVIAFIRRPDHDRFDALGLAVFRHQYDRVAAYRQYCIARGCRPVEVGSLAEVPAVSTVGFKYSKLMSDEFSTAAGGLLFTTSGTTEGSELRGRHFIARPEVYRESAVRHLRTMLFPDVGRINIVALHPTADAMAESSLARMIGWAIEEFGTPASRCCATRDRVDVLAAIESLRAFAWRGEPVCVLGTTAAFAALFERLGGAAAAIRLAPGSRMMDTGGAKGQVLPMSQDEVIALATARLGIEPHCVINEYGMTELCSQLYDATALNSPAMNGGTPRAKVAPPWMRALAIDPVTLGALPNGNVGMLAFFDLANVSSVSAVLTEDFGVVEQGRVRVLGRGATADERGCALGIGEFAAVSTRPRPPSNPRRARVA
ncbi:MAG: hypothetical protein ACREQB_12600 [Candidatus Binataceae bacterium]